MFIPQGKVIHQNLATSYVLVEALVADLRDGGFSGVVEIVLRDGDSHIVFDRGRIAGVVEKRGGQYSTQTGVEELAARSKGERGRVSIYAYALPVARALAGRMLAETLYVKLSTDFADLEKLVNKFLREQDRQWFIEVTSEGSAELIYIDDGRCSLIPSDSVAHENDLEIVGVNNNFGLLQLIKKCNNSGGVFDVLFKAAEAKAEVPVAALPPGGAASVAAPPGEIEAAPEPESPAENQAAAPIEEPLSLDESPAAGETREPLDEGLLNLGFELPAIADDSPIEIPSSLANDFSLQALPEVAGDEPDSFSAASTNGPESATAEAQAPPPEEPGQPAFEEMEVEIPAVESRKFAPIYSGVNSDGGDNGGLNLVRPSGGTPKRPTGDRPRDVKILPTRELMALTGDNATADLKMAEIKRLMGEIAKTIEDVLRIVEQRDDFPMHLRAGQLKIADQYPFLDPFGAEFEYMEGEIVFVGKASAEEFIAGVTDALRLALTSALQASASSARLRSFIVDKLRSIFNRSREEYLAYDLDASLEQIAGVQFV
jgi:hypothetical protein